MLAWENEPSLFQALKENYTQDLSLANQISKIQSSDKINIYEFPNQSWSRRVQGVFANQTLNQHPDQALVLLIKKEKGFMVSVRAPQTHPFGADTVCLQFDGGGRALAAGINCLAFSQKDHFIKAMHDEFC